MSSRVGPNTQNNHGSICHLEHKFILNIKFILNPNFILNLKPYLSQRRPKEGQGKLPKSSKNLINHQKIKSSISPMSAATLFSLLGPNLVMYVQHSRIQYLTYTPGSVEVL